MKSEELLYSLDHVGEDLLAAADQTILARKHQPWGRIAVAAVLVTALGFGSFRLLAHKMASTTPAAELNPSASTLTPVSNATEPVAQDPAQLVGVMLSESGSYNDGRSYSFRLPRINADTPGAKAINEAIDQKWGETIRDELNHNQGNDRRIDFTQTVWGDILSVIIYGETFYDFTDYEAYLYEISTGRWLNSLELLDRLGVSKDTFLKACQVEFQQREQNKGVTSSFFEAAPVEQNGTFYRHYSESEERDVPFEVYPDENGQLVVIAPLTSVAGGAFHYGVISLDLTNADTSDSSEDLTKQDNESEVTEAETPDMAALQAEIDALFNNGQWDNPYLQALTCYYESPQRVDLYQFFYNGVGLEPFESEEQKTMLASKYEYFSDNDVGADRLTAEKMDEILRQCFGIGFEDADKSTLRYKYVPETDSYYHRHGDTNAIGRMHIHTLAPMSDGRILCAYSTSVRADEAEDDVFLRTVALKKENGSYHIQYNLPGEMLFSEEVNAPLFNSAWRMENEAGTNGSTLRELEISSMGMLSYREGAQNSEFNYFSRTYIDELTLKGNDTICCTLSEAAEDGNRIGDKYEARFSFAMEGDTLVLTQLSERGFHNDPKGAVLRFQPYEKEDD